MLKLWQLTKRLSVKAIINRKRLNVSSQEIYYIIS